MKKSEDKNELKPSIYNEDTFYEAFIQDLKKAKKEVIILCPYALTQRMDILAPVFEDALGRKIKLFIITRPPKEYKKKFQEQGEKEIQRLKQMGVQVVFSKNDNRKIAIIDRKLVWDGSINILSQIQSRETMFRWVGIESAKQMLDFLQLGTAIQSK